MAFEPDIVVIGPEPWDVALVVDVQTSCHDVDESERQLKSYVAAVRCPLGLLVTPERLRIYRDKYLPSEDDSIVQVGKFDISGLLPFRTSDNAADDELAFERQVQSWLEELGTEPGLRELPAEVRRAAEMFIVSALAQGAVHAGHPRSPMTVRHAPRVRRDELGG